GLTPYTFSVSYRATLAVGLARCHGGKEDPMFNPQNRLHSRDLGEPGSLAQLEAAGDEIMMPATPFAVLAERCGLSQREAAEFLKVRLDTVKSWSAGRNAAKPAVLAELRALYGDIQAAAENLSQENERLLKQQRE